MKRFLALVLAALMVFALCSCAQKKPADDGGKKLRVVLVGNQKFGDGGPMDSMAEGGEQAARDLDIEFKKIESDPASYEEDVRSMAQEGYDLVIASFGPMVDAVKTVSKEFPDTYFAGIYQNFNTEEENYPNACDCQFFGMTTLYVDGYMAGLTTKTGKIGLIIGGQEPGTSSEGNGFMQGVYDANPNAVVKMAYGSYEDTAKVKEVALAMIAEGCDFIQGDCGSADSGIMEAINETTDRNVNGFSVICDFTSTCDNFCGSIGMNYGQAVYDMMKALADGNFPGGKTSVRDITNKGFFLDWPTYEAFAERSEEYGTEYAKAIEIGKEIEAKIMRGEIVVEYNPEVPDWSNYAK